VPAAIIGAKDNDVTREANIKGKVDYWEMTGEQFAAHVAELHRNRVRATASERKGRPKRATLTPQQAAEVFAKTDGRCHICGGEIDSSWQADHVMAHSAGGQHVVENYLPAHALCNNYRWHYSMEEFQIIMKLGVLAKTLIEKGVGPGPELAEAFVRKEHQRIKRTRGYQN
jgi:hypothetical protein